MERKRPKTKPISKQEAKLSFGSGAQADLKLDSTYPVITMLEQALVHADEIINNFMDIFFVVDSQGTVLRANHLGASFFKQNVSRSGLGSRVESRLPLSEIFTHENWRLFEVQLQNLISIAQDVESRGLDTEVQFELPLVSSLGSRTVYWTVRFITGVEAKSGAIFSVVGRDISVSLLLEEGKRELEFRNSHIQAILDSALQAFMTFDRNLRIEKDYSKRAEELFGEGLAGKNICDVLNLDQTSFSGFADVVFQGTSWDVLKSFSKMEREVGERIIKIEVAPIVEDGKVKKILAAVTDATELTLLQRKTDATSRLNRCMVKILQAKGLFMGVLREVNEADPKVMDHSHIKRLIHTWKGEFGFFDCQAFLEICRRYEDLFAITFSVKDVSNFLEELKTAINSFLDQHDGILKIREANENEFLVNFGDLKELVRKSVVFGVPEDLLKMMERMLEVPFSKAVVWLNEMWLSAGEKLGKKVNPIEWENSDPIFSDGYKPLLTSLIHAVRNAADHGIEYPQEREAAGKPKAGRMVAKLELREGMYHLTLSDDGRGVDVQRVRNAAERQGIKVSNDESLFDLLFEENFSTRHEVSDFSGRGIGLNAIRNEARMLGGDARIRNRPQGGSELQVSFRKKSLVEVIQN